MTLEQLVALGLTEDQASKALTLHKGAIDGNYVPKHRFDEVNSELSGTKKQLGERDNQNKDLQKFEGDNKSLKEKLDNLQQENKQMDSNYKQELALERKKNAVKVNLLADEKSKPHDVDMVLGLFDLDKVEVGEDGTVKGLDEQVKTIKTEKSFLFSEATPTTENKSNPQIKPVGTPPKEGEKGAQTGDDSASYGKSLAQKKLGMLGIQPTSNES